MRRAWVLVLLLSVAGCGGSSRSGTTATAPPGGAATAPANTPVAVAQAYVDALGAGDYATDCALIAKNTRIQVTQNGKLDCSRHFGTVMDAAGASAKAFFHGAKVRSPRVRGDNATVVIVSTRGKRNQLALVREGGRWKVAS